MDQWWIRKGFLADNTEGPFTLSELVDRIYAGDVTLKTLVAGVKTHNQWRQLKDVPELKIQFSRAQSRQAEQAMKEAAKKAEKHAEVDRNSRTADEQKQMLNAADRVRPHHVHQSQHAVVCPPGLSRPATPSSRAPASNVAPNSFAVVVKTVVVLSMLVIGIPMVCCCGILVMFSRSTARHGNEVVPEYRTRSNRSTSTPDALDMMSRVFAGRPPRSVIQLKLCRAMTAYGMEISEQNFHRAGSALTALHDRYDVTEMEILQCMIDLSDGAGTAGLNMSFADGAAFATALIKAERENGVR